MVAPRFTTDEIREVSDPSGGLILERRINNIRVATASASADELHDLSTTQGRDRDAVREDLKAALRRLRLEAELDRQVFGYWFGPDEDVPAKPVGRPTGAVLAPIAETFGAVEHLCLDLVPVHNFWLVLSELGRYTYRHTSGLLLGEVWHFVPVTEIVGSWPIVYEVSYAESLSATEVAEAYGFEASTRTRPDALAVRLRLVRLS